MGDGFDYRYNSLDMDFTSGHPREHGHCTVRGDRDFDGGNRVVPVLARQR